MLLYCFLLCVGGGSVFRFCEYFFFKQKTAYEMRISDWSSDVCSSDLVVHAQQHRPALGGDQVRGDRAVDALARVVAAGQLADGLLARQAGQHRHAEFGEARQLRQQRQVVVRSEEHTSELQSLMRISYAVFCLKQKTNNTYKQKTHKYTN